MALETVAHIQFTVLIDLVHGFHRTMTINALEAFANMPLVREESVVRKRVNALPFNRLPCVVSFRQLNNVWLVNGDHAVAVHAHIKSGHRGVLVVFHRAVTDRHLTRAVTCMDLWLNGIGWVGAYPWLLHDHMNRL